MVILLSLLVFSVILGLIVPKVNLLQRNKKIYLVIVFGVLCLYSSLRGSNVGIDTYNYLSYFYEIKGKGLITSLSELRLEKGYILLNYILGLFFNNAQIVLIVSSLFICYAFATLIYRYSSNVVISTFLYIMFLFSSSMNIMRQFFAFSIIIFSYKYILERKVIRAGLLIAIASFFHNTAILFSPILLIAFSKVKINKKTIIMISAIFIFGVSILDKVMDKFFKLFPMYERFMSSKKYTSESEISLLLIIFYVAILVCLIIIISKKNYKTWFNFKGRKVIKHNNGMPQKTLAFFTIMMIGNVVCSFISSKLWIASRIMAYTKPAISIVIPTIFNGVLPNKSVIKYLCVSLFFLVFFIWAYSMFLRDPHGIVPYTFFWT